MVLKHHRPYKLSPKESKSLNELPVAKLDRANIACQAAFGHLNDGAVPKHHLRAKLEHLQDRTMEAKRRYNKAVRELRNKKNKQPVIDLERQLVGKLVDSKVMGTLKHKGFMPSQHLIVIDATLTMPSATLEAEYQRRINAINAITAFCPVEEGRPTPRPVQSCRRPMSDDDESYPPAKRQQRLSEDYTDFSLRQAMETVRIKSENERPTVCFLCLGNPNLPLNERIAKHATPGSLTRHFLRKHVNRPWPARGVECNVCGIELFERKADLLNHAERCHGTVV
ncbi:hypothetical protein PHISCL_08753 [Aspergillus sclerotialis]|uniref:C2H2-type domain-containing protein n=1 Tax=Aspergillus sclerotialis TaxID=2070753 RepID=A0A3A2ZHV0_9EURO|nr:hypothetical protein PHISCL_08753 [Aspergillus sclerotialis]